MLALQTAWQAPTRPMQLNAKLQQYVLGPLTSRLRAAALSVNSTQSALNKANNEAQAALVAVENRVAQAQADVTARIYALGNYTSLVSGSPGCSWSGGATAWHCRWQSPPSQPTAHWLGSWPHYSLPAVHIPAAPALREAAKLPAASEAGSSLSQLSPPLCCPGRCAGQLSLALRRTGGGQRFSYP